ncbi:putative lipase ROG1 isoform X1 [Lolium perenne]|uniref:putative lipase ROG1 isoform X1 n=1 Tax=Lolium perenne TaxID=4522 RepID=UPI0021EA56C5|nr:putative lipase ROG1 isoform X1 [Lolium perenne]
MAEGEGGERRRGRRRWLPAACVPRPGCFTVSAADEGPSGSGAEEEGSRPAPTHLVVTVNGIVGSADDWVYAAKHFIKKHPEDVVVHCSGCNSATRTFHGVDVMGRRLADEVISVVKCRPELKKISFVAHSLGGLIARYAIALLYENETATQTDCNEECEKDVNDARRNQPTGRGKIAGLEPMNFITFATPHLGTRSHKQMPLLRGSYRLEKMAFRMSWLAGRSGKHLFLKDIEEEKPPLLLQMVTDYGDLHFISALRSFKRRVAYSNVCGDFIVGLRTSSIRRQHELPKKQDFVHDGKYPHVVHVEKPKSQDVDFSDAMIYQAKTTSEMEEVMLKSLNRIPWERVDVSFKKSRQRFFAHSTIQVKTYFLNSDGADVIFHMIDHFIY